MNSTISKYLNAFKSMELNKTTEDVDIDIKHLQVGQKLKSFSYYAGISLLSVGLYIGSLNYIKYDTFRADLIEKAQVNPFSTFFYSDYADELQKAITAKDEMNNKLVSLEREQRQAKRFSYKYRDFLSDIKSGKVYIDFDKFLKKPIEEYMNAYFLAYVVQNQNSMVALGSKEYSYKDISVKVSKLNQEIALEKLNIPTKTILEALRMDLIDTNVKALSKALHKLSKLNYKNTAFYKSLELKADAREYIKIAILSNKSSIKLNGAGYGQKIYLPQFKEAYQVQTSKEKVLYDANKQKMEAKKMLLQTEVKNLEQNIQLVDSLIRAINSLKTDVTNYDINKELVETALGDLKWNQ